MPSKVLQPMGEFLTLYHISIVYHFLFQLSLYRNSFLFLWPLFNIFSSSSSSGFSVGIHQNSVLCSPFLSLCEVTLSSSKPSPALCYWWVSGLFSSQLLHLHSKKKYFLSTWISPSVILLLPVSSANFPGIPDWHSYLMHSIHPVLHQVLLTCFLNIFSTGSGEASAHWLEASLASTATPFSPSYSSLVSSLCLKSSWPLNMKWPFDYP